MSEGDEEMLADIIRRQIDKLLVDLGRKDRSVVLKQEIVDALLDMRACCGPET